MKMSQNSSLMKAVNIKAGVDLKLPLGYPQARGAWGGEKKFPENTAQ